MTGDQSITGVGFRVTWENDVFSNAFDYFRSVSCLSTWRPVFFHRAARLREEEFPSQMTTEESKQWGNTASNNDSPYINFRLVSFHGSLHVCTSVCTSVQTRVSQYSSQRHIKGSRFPFPEIRAVNEKGIDLTAFRSAKGCVSEELLCAVP